MNQPPGAKYVDRSLVSFQPSLPEGMALDLDGALAEFADRPMLLDRLILVTRRS